MNLTLFLIDIRLITYTIFNTSLKAFPKPSDLRLGVSSIDLEKGRILLDKESLMQKLIFNYDIMSKGKLTFSIRLIDMLVAVPSIFIIWRAHNPPKAIRYMAGLMLTLITQHAFISAMIHVIGAEQSSLADALTLSRGATGAILAGLMTSGIRERKGIAGRMGWLMPLLGVTDWLDGALARRAGPTLLGGVLDIEADSWLTLWSAAGAVAWGEVPGWCLLPPIIHYLEPLQALTQGKLPRGGGPWWYRSAGASQMGFLIVALAPFDWWHRKQFLTAASIPISIGQCTAIFVRLAMILKHNRVR
jgi:phosphatidylglycerophosphate synthase